MFDLTSNRASFSRVDLETSPRFRKCDGSGFGFSTFREPVTVSLDLLSREIAILLITRVPRKDHSHLRRQA